MRYLKLPIVVVATFLNLLSAATAAASAPSEQSFFTDASDRIRSLVATYSPSDENFKANLNTVREQILDVYNEAQATAEEKLQAIKDGKLTFDQKFTESEEVITQTEALLRVLTSANDSLDKHLWDWISDNIIGKLCPEHETIDPALTEMVVQLTQNDYMRLARKCNNLKFLAIITTLYTTKDNARAVHAARELSELERLHDATTLDEATAKRQTALKNFLGCIRAITNCAQTLAEIQTDTYDGAESDTALDRYTLRNRVSLTTAYALSAEQFAETPVLLELARTLRRETAHALKKKFLETFSPTIRMVNQLRIKAMTKAVALGVNVEGMDLFLTNTSFLSIADRSLTALLGEEDTDYIVRNRDALRLHPGFSEEMFLPDQLFNSLLVLSNASCSHGIFPLPTKDEIDRFATENPSIFAAVQVDPSVVELKVREKLKSRFADTLSEIAERVQLFAMPKFDAATNTFAPNPLDARLQAFIDAQPAAEMQVLRESIMQEPLPNALYTTAHKHLLFQRRQQALAFIGEIHAHFFNTELDFAKEGIDPLSEFGKLWARYHTMRDLIGTLNIEAFKIYAHEFFKANAKSFFSPTLKVAPAAIAPLHDMLPENFYADPFTKAQTDDGSVKRLQDNERQVQETLILLGTMPDSDAKQLATKLLGSWVTAGTGKAQDVWVEAGREALAVAYMQIKKYLPGVDGFTIWKSVKKLAEVLATTKLAEKEPFQNDNARIRAAHNALSDNEKAVVSIYGAATQTLCNLEPVSGARVLLNACGIRK